jgi:hypothetical protein
LVQLETTKGSLRKYNENRTIEILTAIIKLKAKLRNRNVNRKKLQNRKRKNSEIEM